MVSTVTGLSRLGSRWYVLIVIPPDIHEVFIRRRVNLALSISDRREATLLAAIQRVEWLADFEAKRSALKPSAIAAVSPQLAALRAERNTGYRPGGG